MMKTCKAALVAVIAVAPALGQDWFGAPRLYLHNTPVSVVIDVGGDGDLDLIRMAPGGAGTAVSYTVMVNPGDEDFVDAPTVPFPAGTSLAVAGGDVTGDGIDDLLVGTTQAYATGSGFLVYPGSASGVFGAATHTSIPVAIVRALHLADVNGDGVLDVGTWRFDALGGTFQWHPSLGGGAFATWPGVTIPAAQLSSTGASMILDTNGDGTKDAALAGTSAIFLCPTFGSASVPGPVIPSVTPASQDAFGAGDIDGDGDDDIVYAGGTPNPQVPAAMLPNLVRIMNLGGGAWSSPVLQNFGPPTYWPGARLSIADWDGDGYADVVLSIPRPNPTSASLAQTRVFAGSATGSLALGFLLLSWAVDPAPVGIFDVSGDGLPDLVGGYEIVFGVGGMTSPFGNLAGTAATVSPRDWDGDGDLDFESVSAPGSWHVNDGRGMFTPVQLTLPPPPTNLLVSPNSLPGDFNGDQRLDWVVGIQTAPNPPSFPFGSFINYRMYSDAGNGALIDLGVVGTALPLLVVNGHRAIVIDVNADGFDDVIGHDALWYSNGAGGLAPSSVTYPGQTPVAAGDIDGDSDIDFVVTSWSFPTASVTLMANVGGGVFNALGIDTGASALADARIVDLDDDGDADVITGYGTVYANTGSVVHIVENLANTGSSLTHQLSFPSLNLQLVLASVDAGDVDGDGKTDLVIGLAAPFSGPPLVTAFAVMRRLGPGLVFDPPRLWSTPGFVRLADLDGDGDLDATGPSLLFNRKFHGPSAGSSRQFGASSPGSGGIFPILGRGGPVRPGNPITIRLRRGLGGATGLLVFGAAQSSVTYPGLPGIVSYAEPWAVTLPIVLNGIPGSPGAGGCDLGATIPVSLAGTALYLQAGVIDPGAGPGVSVTNGLEILFGN